MYYKKMANKFKFGKITEKVTKGFKYKSVNIKNSNDTTMSLADIKEIEGAFQNNIEEGSKFLIKGRNKYGTKTLRSYDGRWYNENADYYDAIGYDKSEFEKIFQVQIVYLE